MTGGRRGGGRAVRRMHLAVELPGEGERALSPPDFDAYARLARTAERGLFDFLLLAERPAPADGRTVPGAGPDWDPAAAGPEPITVLNALAAVTDFLGLAVAVTPGDREPYALARRIAALDRLSAGRAAGPAAVVPEFTVPYGPQGRPVVIQGGADEGAEVVVVTDARGRTRSGVRVLARIEYVLTAEPGPGVAGPDPGVGPGSGVDGEGATDGGRGGEGAPSAGSGAGSSAGSSATSFAALFDGPLTGPPRALADRLDAHVQSGAVDGYLLLPEPAPGGRGLDAFVDRVVPLLQEGGSLPTAYRGTTLREHLGLPRPAWQA